MQHDPVTEMIVQVNGKQEVRRIDHMEVGAEIFGLGRLPVRQPELRRGERCTFTIDGRCLIYRIED